jgi:hypothetical protein
MVNEPIFLQLKVEVEVAENVLQHLFQGILRIIQFLKR